MQAEIIQMKKELAGILASDKALKLAVGEVNKIDIIRGSLIVRNSRHQQVEIDRILSGELIKDIAVGDYVFIQNCGELMNLAYNNMAMGNSIDRNFLTAAYRILSENPKGTFRSDNPVVYAFSHVPPHYADIDTRLSMAVRRAYSDSAGVDAIAKAMYLHNAIINVWPFEDFNGEIAVFAMNYYLMCKGFMPIDMPIDRQSYMDMVAEGIKGKKLEEEYRFIRNAVVEKLARTIKICSSYVQ